MGLVETMQAQHDGVDVRTEATPGARRLGGRPTASEGEHLAGLVDEFTRRRPGTSTSGARDLPLAARRLTVAESNELGQHGQER